MTNEVYKFPCGCAFPVKGYAANGKPMLKFDPDEDFRDCPEVWKLFHKGLTVGVFQFETPLGRKWCREAKPNRIQDLEALTAILRPGCLEAKDENNVSLTDHYCRRKNGLEEPAVEFPELSDILSETYHILVYQEQQIFIAEKLAGFDKCKADTQVRKGIAKKDPKVLFQIEQDFIEGCKKLGKVTEEQAKKIFGWIKAGARYSFNRCLSLETVVETPDGLQSIGEINIGDSVKCPDGSFSQVINKFESEIELFEVTLESGKRIQCSMTHKFKCQDGEVRKLIDIVLEGHKILCEDD